MAASLTVLLVGSVACSTGQDPPPPTPAPSYAQSSSPGLVPKEQVERTISEKLAAQVGRQPKKVECPQGLPAQQGVSIRCVLTAGDDSTVGVTATVTAVARPDDPGSVSYDIAADQEVTPAPAPGGAR